MFNRSEVIVLTNKHINKHSLLKTPTSLHYAMPLEKKHTEINKTFTIYGRIKMHINTCKIHKLALQPVTACSTAQNETLSALLEQIWLDALSHTRSDTQVAIKTHRNTQINIIFLISQITVADV